MIDAQSLSNKLAEAISDLTQADRLLAAANDGTTSHYGFQRLHEDRSKARDALANVLLDLKQWVKEP
jgi:hypothetical protein